MACATLVTNKSSCEKLLKNLICNTITAKITGYKHVTGPTTNVYRLHRLTEHRRNFYDTLSTSMGKRISNPWGSSPHFSSRNAHANTFDIGWNTFGIPRNIASLITLRYIYTEYIQSILSILI